MQYNEVQIRSKSAIVYKAYAHTGNRGSWSSAASIEHKIADSQAKNNICSENKNVDQVKKPYSGKMTHGAKKRLTKALSLMVQSSPHRYIYNPVTQRRQKFQLSFVTLTVSSVSKMLTAKEAHKLLLEPFLLYLRRRHQVKNYVWKAELQKRGQIHYHITLDQFVLYSDIRDTWNNLQEKHGLLEDYKALGTGRPANSTDVHSIKKVLNVEAYMVKYMSKDNADDEGTVGKVWDCSVVLKATKYYSTAMTYEMERTINYMIQSKNADVVDMEWCSIIKFSGYNANYILGSNDLFQYNKLMDNIRGGFLPLASLGGSPAAQADQHGGLALVSHAPTSPLVAGAPVVIQLGLFI